MEQSQATASGESQDGGDPSAPFRGCGLGRSRGERPQGHVVKGEPKPVGARAGQHQHARPRAWTREPGAPSTSPTRHRVRQARAWGLGGHRLSCGRAAAGLWGKGEEHPAQV